eukprot:COSAG01_NODE_15786_length_1300_cov_1.204829_1_plen_433_part_11
MVPPFALLLACCASAPSVAAAAETIFNGVRVQAMSPTLVRIEPMGPTGFVNSTTFVVVDRASFPGVPLRTKASNLTHITLETDYYTVEIGAPPLAPPAPPTPPHSCKGRVGYDITSGRRVGSCGRGALSCLPRGATQMDCCGNCTAKQECKAWVYQPSRQLCWLMATAGGLKKRDDRVSGGDVSGGGGTTGVSATVLSPAGQVLWHTTDLGSVGQNLNWPSPSTNGTSAYALKDYPRFFAPEWGPTPIPAGEKAKLDPATVATNGYDYRINVDGDTYVFLLGGTLDSWWAARSEFATLAGPTPVLPDWAFGTWFTFWHTYTEDEAKGEILRWHSDKLPIDVWALDMNWRDSPHANQGHYIPNSNHDYDHPNTKAFPDFADPGTGWFDWLKTTGKVRTYFNDHPFPQNCTAKGGGITPCMQTSAEEVAFRWEGL